MQNILPFKTKTNSQLPDFIIVGAMKSGTTSLHHILNQHKNIFIPARELAFFDLDVKKYWLYMSE